MREGDRKMNEFELFTMIFYTLDYYYKNDLDDVYINTVLSDMNPFIWEDECSGDPLMYDEYLEFLNGREITLDNSLEIAREYVATIEYADVTAALRDMSEERWINGCKKFLSEPHKGMK